jgi:hypothetical protein
MNQGSSMGVPVVTAARGCLVLGAVALLPAALGRWAAEPLLALVATHRAGHQPTFESLLLACAACAVLLCAGWLVLAVAAGVQEALTGRAPALARRLTPLAVRRTTLLACGAAVGSAALVAPATADTAEAAPPASATVLTGLPLPDRTTGPLLPGAVRHDVAPDHVVRPGDSLWRIAARLLGPDSPDQDVAEAMRALYRANRAAIGADPDLLLPGQHLELPRTLPAHREDAP